MISVEQSSKTNRSLPVCGNGILELGEDCDDSSDPDTRRCLGDCSGALPGYECRQIRNSSICFVKSRRLQTCANFKLEAGETCDDGNTVDSDGCDSLC